MPRHRPPRGQNPRGGKREGAGRPRGPTAFKHLRDLAQSGTEKAVLTIANIMEDKSNPARLRMAAASAILDLGYGKPRKGEVVEQEDRLTTPDPPDQTLKQAAPAPIAERSATKSDRNGKAASGGQSIHPRHRPGSRPPAASGQF